MDRAQRFQICRTCPIVQDKNKQIADLEIERDSLVIRLRSMQENQHTLSHDQFTGATDDF